MVGKGVNQGLSSPLAPSWPINLQVSLRGCEKPAQRSKPISRSEIASSPRFPRDSAQWLGKGLSIPALIPSSMSIPYK